MRPRPTAASYRPPATASGATTTSNQSHRRSAAPERARPNKSRGGKAWRASLLFDGKFDAAVLGASLFGVVGRDRVGLAVADGRQALGGDARLDEILGHRLGAPPRQLHVGVVAADGIRVA